MLLCKMFMYRFYILSMHENGAAKATVYNFTVNYCASLFLGAVLFNEAVSARLCLGVSLILAGTSIIGLTSE